MKGEFTFTLHSRIFFYKARMNHSLPSENFILRIFVQGTSPFSSLVLHDKAQGEPTHLTMQLKNCIFQQINLKRVDENYYIQSSIKMTYCNMHTVLKTSSSSQCKKCQKCNFCVLRLKTGSIWVIHLVLSFR